MTPPEQHSAGRILELCQVLAVPDWCWYDLNRSRMHSRIWNCNAEERQSLQQTGDKLQDTSHLFQSLQHAEAQSSHLDRSVARKRMMEIWLWLPHLPSLCGADPLQCHLPEDLLQVDHHLECATHVSKGSDLRPLVMLLLCSGRAFWNLRWFCQSQSFELLLSCFLRCPQCILIGPPALVIQC